MKQPVEQPTVEPLNLDSLLGRCKNRIALVGIEMEGGWVKVPPRTRVERDGSVFKNPSSKTLSSLEKLNVSAIGEIVSEPMSPIGIPAWVKKNYPAFTDHTCGLHMHMSFKDNWHYQQLMIPEFQQTVLLYLKTWAIENELDGDHPIHERLSGENEYCNQMFWPDDQLRTGIRKDYDHHRRGNRYSAIAYRRKNSIYTIECRVLPMMATPELAVSALKQVLRITNAFLVRVKNRKVKVKDVAEDSEVPYLELDTETI